MSRCAQGTFPTKCCRKSAALIAPPYRPPVFLRSATGLLISSSISGGSGMRQMGSPAVRAAACSSPASASSLLKSPVIHGPSATRMAPVRVARSITAAGFSSTAQASTSASTSRPSASVLSTSTLVPLLPTMTSPGL